MSPSLLPQREVDPAKARTTLTVGRGLHSILGGRCLPSERKFHNRRGIK